MTDLYYYLSSEKTGHPYMTEDLIFFAYGNSEQAELSSQKKRDVSVSGPRDKAYLLQMGYSIGAKRIRFCIRDEITETEIAKRPASEKYYNPRLNAMLIMAKQTREYIWLRKLKSLTIITAIRFRDPLMIRTEYATVHKKGQNEYMYLAFSDLDEYSVWISSDTVKRKDFMPVEMSFKTFCQLCGRKGCMFNPAGNRLVLNNETLKKINKEG